MGYVIFSRHTEIFGGYQLSEEPGFMLYRGEAGEHLISGDIKPLFPI